MLIGILLSFLSTPPQNQPSDLVHQIAASGRCASLAELPDQRVGPPTGVAPGTPPVLAFRYYEGKLHKRYDNIDLMLDDAGH